MKCQVMNEYKQLPGPFRTKILTEVLSAEAAPRFVMDYLRHGEHHHAKYELDTDPVLKMTTIDLVWQPRRVMRWKDDQPVVVWWFGSELTSEALWCAAIALKSQEGYYPTVVYATNVINETVQVRGFGDDRFDVRFIQWKKLPKDIFLME